MISSTNSIRSKLDEKIAMRSSLNRDVESFSSQVVKEERNLDNAIAAQEIVQTTAKEVQSLAHHRISSVVSRCLESVFDDPYDFRILFEEKRGKTEAQIQFVRNDNAVDPLSAAGGGVVDVAAFALRIAAISLVRPRIRKLVVLDEPFRFLSSEYRPRVANLLKRLAEDMSFQIIMVTHIDQLRIGTVVELE